GLARRERNPILACIPSRSNMSPADVEDAVCYSISMCLRFYDHRLFPTHIILRHVCSNRFGWFGLRGNVQGFAQITCIVGQYNHSNNALRTQHTSPSVYAQK
ncbi:hypothetical protein KCU77_g19965, partial [Aureobasidium melanogenum]